MDELINNIQILRVFLHPQSHSVLAANVSIHFALDFSDRTFPATRATDSARSTQPATIDFHFTSPLLPGKTNAQGQAAPAEPTILNLNHALATDLGLPRSGRSLGQHNPDHLSVAGRAENDRGQHMIAFLLVGIPNLFTGLGPLPFPGQRIKPHSLGLPLLLVPTNHRSIQRNPNRLAHSAIQSIRNRSDFSHLGVRNHPNALDSSRGSRRKLNNRRSNTIFGRQLAQDRRKRAVAARLLHTILNRRESNETNNASNV